MYHYIMIKQRVYEIMKIKIQAKVKSHDFLNDIYFDLHYKYVFLVFIITFAVISDNIYI